MKYFWTRFLPSYPKVLLYMLQSTEYNLGQYLTWFNRTADFRRVMKRRTLDMTKKVRILLLAIQAIVFVILLVIIAAVYLSTVYGQMWLLVALLLLITAPFIVAYGLAVPLFIGELLIQRPREKVIIANAQKKLNDHPGRRIAVAGSFGKTTAKEILKVVIGEGMNVAATPGNMNTPIGISRFVMKLKGDEDILVFELGEEKVGDVRELSRLVHPEYAIITGINEAHLSSFGSLENTVATIFEIEKFVKPEKLYKNEQSPLVKSYKNKSTLWFSDEKAGDWQVGHISTAIDGTEFTMTRQGETIHAKTGLVGVHTVGVTAAAVAMAYELGVSIENIENGLRKVRPFEHRMEPRPMHGAWVIDDTYNGNSQGVEAGLSFLKSSGAKRRIYVTPGLVEQGSKVREIHETIGRQIAGSVDVVVLMQNSVTEYIKAGLTREKFNGKLIEIDNPLQFYTNLDQFVAAGDIVLMQNDWTDNYQ
ncbi:MAG: hypothetical protein JWN28_396 [Candidatus Saccharibacteria bacterium]|nr:hypothetical protein [Candidatus Saccharibacteria bacterium]